jgi:FAD:protein FMN transferase
MIFKLLLGKALWNALERMADPEEARPAADESGRTSAAPDSSAEAPEPVLASSATVFPRVQRRAMGSLFEIYLAGTERDALVSAAEEALDQVQRLEDQLSHYRDDSDIARLNANACEQWVRLEPRLYALIKRCLDLSQSLDGAFDITAGPLVKAWGFFRGEGRIPSDQELADVMERVGFYRVMSDDEANLIRFASPGMDLNLGAVGKGYAIDEAADILRLWGAQNGVIHGGQSTIYAFGDEPAEARLEAYEDRQRVDEVEAEDSTIKLGWRFVIRDPRDRDTPLQTVYLRDEALSTSGNYEQFFEHEGVRYSHIIDPVTGRPAKGMISVSVITQSAAESDALSTAFFVLGRGATEEYCSNRPNIRVVMVEEAPGGEISVTRIGFETSDVSNS